MTPTELQQFLRDKLRKAYNLGQTWWQQADSEYRRENKKADETAAKFAELVENVVLAVTFELNRAASTEAAKATGTAGEPMTMSYVQNVPDHCDRITWRGAYYHLKEGAEAARQPAPVVIPHMPEDITTDDALWRAGCKAFRAALNEMTGRDGYVVKKTYEALREHILAATNRSQP